MRQRTNVFAHSLQRRLGRAKDFDSHSPMFKNRHSDEARRTRMFADYPHVWGRFPKLTLGFMALMQYWAGYHLN